MLINKYLFALLFFRIVVFGQNTENKYLLTYLEKRIASKEWIQKVEEYPQLIKEKILREIKTGEEKMLFLTKNVSFYSLKEAILNEQTLGERTVKITLTDYYKKYKDDQLLIQKKIGEEKVLIKDDLHPFQWELTNEKRKIKSFMCKKAISTDSKGNELIAWYTEAIKISNGPAQYGGLPGLIIKLKSKYRTYELKEFEQTNTTNKIDFPSIENAITMEVFKKQYNPKNAVRKTVRYN